MLRPTLVSVQFHPAYEACNTQYKPTMTAIDTEGRVWRTWQGEAGWQPWEAVIEFTNPYA